jgi:hypothetical protein
MKCLKLILIQQQHSLGFEEQQVERKKERIKELLVKKNSNDNFL